MTEAEEQQLRAMGAELSAANASGEEPRCIVRTFATPRDGERFTMQHWIDLEEIRSPLLLGALPELEQLEASLNVFALSRRSLSPEEAADVADQLRQAIADGFGMALRMQPKGGTSSLPCDGFGSWLPLMTFLEVECGKSHEEAAGYAVGQAFALLASTRRSQGWEPQGETYAQREVIGKEAANG